MSQFQRRLFFAAAAGILSWLPALQAQAQEPTRVAGRVTSVAGAPISSATVFLEGMGIGAQTNDDGRYVLSVPAARATGQTVAVAIRRIGFQAASKPVVLTAGTSQTVDFTLSEASVKLSEVVVTGAGTVSTVEKLGNAISSVKAEAIERSNETNVVAALAAQAPGVQVTSTSGEPGASAYIQIRGSSTIQGTGQPLFVVDGTPIDNSSISTGTTGSYVSGTVSTNRAADINPADIESIQILKGAAAAAIYGARAAQGVVLITTKSGRPGKTHYSLRSTYTVDEVTQGPAMQRTYGQGYDGNAAVCAEAGCSLTRYTWGAELPAGTPTYDHFAELFRAGHLFDNTLTISGGTEKTTFYLSGGRSAQQGTIVGPNNQYDKTSVRLKGTFAVNDRLHLGGNVAYTDARGNFTQKGSNVSGLLLGALRTSPEFNSREWIDPATGLHRSYRYPQPLASSIDESRGYDNPFFTAYMNPATSNVGHTMGSVNADYIPFGWLTIDCSFTT